jgi:peptidoglycan/xylan/chitin deacetylase (PgdA/CDA1 family)
MLYRDLVGYGGKPPTVRWPNDALVAVSIVVNYEEGAELAYEQGDPTNETIGEVRSVVADGQRDLGMEQIFSYGTRAGLWRFLDAFDRHDCRATFYMCGRAVERTPELAAEVVRRGHEPACHGWRWQPHTIYADEQSERRELERSVDIVSAATGVRPVGFFCRGSQSKVTRRLLAELGFEYDSNALDDDLPYYDHNVPSRPLLILPYAFDSNDMKFFHPNGFVTPDQFVNYVRAGIDLLLQEGKRGYPKLFNIGLHLRITGRPARFAAVEEILRYLTSLRDRIWLARRIDIARFWREKYPA